MRRRRVLMAAGAVFGAGCGSKQNGDAGGDDATATDTATATDRLLPSPSATDAPTETATVKRIATRGQYDPSRDEYVLVVALQGSSESTLTVLLTDSFGKTVADRRVDARNLVDGEGAVEFGLAGADGGEYTVQLVGGSESEGYRLLAEKPVKIPTPAVSVSNLEIELMDTLADTPPTISIIRATVRVSGARAVEIDTVTATIAGYEYTLNRFSQFTLGPGEQHEYAIRPADNIEPGTYTLRAHVRTVAGIEAETARSVTV